MYEIVIGESLEAIRNHRCPDCGATLRDGPCGGLSINVYCTSKKCGSKFNDMFVFGAQRISEPQPLANAEVSTK